MVAQALSNHEGTCLQEHPAPVVTAREPLGDEAGLPEAGLADDAEDSSPLLLPRRQAAMDLLELAVPTNDLREQPSSSMPAAPLALRGRRQNLVGDDRLLDAL